MGQRLRTYKRIASARDDETLEPIRLETEDRYGKMPESVARLFEYARLRRTAERMNVISIDRTPTGVAIKLGERARVAPEKLLNLVAERAGVTFSPNGVLRLEIAADDAPEIVETVHRVLLEIRAED
jgi:transcription-repair coupling factor (superfamily II helicase)